MPLSFVVVRLVVGRRRRSVLRSWGLFFCRPFSAFFCFYLTVGRRLVGIVCACVPKRSPHGNEMASGSSHPCFCFSFCSARKKKHETLRFFALFTKAV